MKKLAVLLLVVSAPLVAEGQKPVATQISEAMQPASKAVSNSIQETVLEFMAGSEGSLGRGARAALANKASQEAITNRGPRRSMKDCIKPNSVIDDDVKECMEGIREKTWSQ